MKAGCLDMRGLIRREKCLVITAILLSFSSWGRADSLILKEGSKLDTQEVDTSKEIYTLQYSLLTIHYTSQKVDQIALDKPEPKKELFDPFLSSVVEASIPPKNEVIRAALTAHKTFKNASNLKELKPVLASSAYQNLKEKIKTGSQEVTVIELLQGFLPETITVTDVHFDNERVKVAVTGQTRNKNFAGIIEMVKEDASWKLDNETWYADDSKSASVKNSVKMVDFSKISNNYMPQNLPDWYDPYYPTRANPLRLEKANLHMPKDSFFLFYFLNQPKKSDLLEEITDDQMKLHLIWSASFKSLEQQRLPGRYPLDLDVTIAQERDGYMPGKVNLRLPKSRPKEFYVGMLYSF